MAKPTSNKRRRYFLTVALTIYGVLNTYIGLHGWTTAKSFNISPNLFVISWLGLVLAYPVGRWVFDRWPNRFTAGVFFVGSWYLGAMVYLFIGTLFIDVVSVLFAIFPLPVPFSRGIRWLFLGVIGITLGITFYGYWNARRFTIRQLELVLTTSHIPPKNPLRVVLASDFHLGTVIRPQHLKRIVATINQLQPDLVLLPGDILDENLPSAWWETFLQPFQQLHAPLGVLATPGNHEYFIHNKAALRAIQQVGIQLLEDDVVILEHQLAVIGRRDATTTYFGEERLPLNVLLSRIPEGLPVIVMDHQPRQLQEIQENGVQLQVSGHTHDGQFWPFTYITRRVWDVSYGYRRMGSTQVYVTSGIGVWGPPLRIGTRAELVVLTIRLERR